MSHSLLNLSLLVNLTSHVFVVISSSLPTDYTFIRVKRMRLNLAEEYCITKLGLFIESTMGLTKHISSKFKVRPLDREEHGISHTKTLDTSKFLDEVNSFLCGKQIQQKGEKNLVDSINGIYPLLRSKYDKSRQCLISLSSAAYSCKCRASYYVIRLTNIQASYWRVSIESEEK